VSKITLYLFFTFSGLFASDKTIQYLFPLPGSSHLPSKTEVLIRFQDVNPSQIGNFEGFIDLTGDKSGLISGETTILSDQKTIRFLPDHAYQRGETVTVRIWPLLKGENSPFIKKTFHFTVHDRTESDHKTAVPKSKPAQRSVFDHSVNGIMVEDPRILNGVSVPSNFPILNILLSNDPAPGFIFIVHGWASPVTCYMIMDRSGAPVWYNYSNNWFPMNLNLHENGEIAMNATHEHSFGDGYISMDNTYTVVDSFWISWNGYLQNDHEFLLLEDGRYFMIGYKKYDVDMSQYIPGANTNVSVRETAIFGYPAGSRSPNFIWRAFDHFNLEDTDEPEIDELNTVVLRFPHMNALDIDTDGHIVLSSRHLNEITKINIETGEIIWRLGGKHNQFTFVNDPLNGPSCQHDIRALGNNRYTVFDNGNLHNPQISRGVEWELDTTAMAATLVWEYRNTEASPNFSNFMGNNQRLPNGNRLINWAYSHDQFRLVTEVTPEGIKALEFGFEDNSAAYRVYKYEWNAIAKVPYLILEVYSNAVTLIFNKFGDPDVDYYNIYGGTRPNPATIIATSEKPFVHLIHEMVNERRNYFRVTSVNHNGQESGFSNQVDVLVNLIDPGANMVGNGDFENGLTGWKLVLNNGDADYEITQDHQLHLIIHDGGSVERDVQAVYPGLSLIYGKKYRFEFDAFTAQNRVIFIDLESNDYLWNNFSEIGGTWLTQGQKHFSYEFTMNEPSEPEAQIVLNAGADNHDVYIDNVSLKQVDQTKINQLEPLPDTYKLQQNYPNPFNPSTKISYSISKSDFVTLKIVNMLGQEIQTLVNEFQTSGNYTVHFKANNLSSGIYFCHIQIGSGYTETKKMILMQ
jgi:hypothetical protein